MKPDSFLWLHGFAGSGKTVLTSTIIQYTFSHRKAAPQIGRAFYYFRFDQETKRNNIGLLKSLLFQLSSQCSGTILGDLHAKYKLREEPPYQDLLSAFRETIDSFDDVYIIIDAIDECPYGQARIAVCETLETIRAWKMPLLHLLVTSRDEIDIRNQIRYSSEQQLSIQNEGVDADIQKYIREHLRSDQKLQMWASDFIEIEDALIRGARGMCATLQCHHLPVMC